MKKIIYLVLLLSINSMLISQELVPGLIADRPDVTESAVTIPQGYYQIETGFVYQKQKYNDDITLLEIDNITAVSTLVRYGINSFLELRFGGEYCLTKTKSYDVNENVSGLNGLFLGTKLQLWKDKILTNGAVIIKIDVPFGNVKLRPNKFDPTLILAIDREISNEVTFGLNMGYQKNSKEEDNIFLYSGSIGYSITERWGTFIEYNGNAVKYTKPDNYISTGFTYLQKQNLLLDLSAGTKLSDKKNSDWFINFGLSLRVPK